MKKLIFLSALVLLAAGCCRNKLQTNTYSDEQAMPLAEGLTDSLLLSVSLQYPVKGAPDDILDRITHGILSAAFDLEEEPGDVAETAARYENNLKDEYFNENGNGNDTAGIRTWDDRVNGYFSGSCKQYASYMVEYYAFRGGAHGLNTMTPVVFNLKTGDAVPEGTFFADGFRAPVAALIQAHLPEALEGDKEALATVFEPDLVGPNGNYEVTADGVTWYYQPYDIAPYVLGVISVSVPWNELKPYLREKL